MTIPTVDRTCRACGVAFKCTNTQIKNRQGIYCSHACRNVGRAKSPIERFWKHVRKGRTCWLWTASTDEHGYGQLNVNGKPQRAHRFSYQLHYGPLPKDRPCSLHRCDTPLCVRPDHLFPGTRKTNNDDKVSKQRQCRGSKQPLAKLTEADVIDIRATYVRDKFTHREFADRYGVSQGLISRILARKIWVHV